MTGKIEEIVLDGHSFKIAPETIEDFDKTVLYINDPKTLIKFNGEDPFKNGRPITLDMDGKTAEVWNDHDIIEFFSKNNIDLIKT